MCELIWRLWKFYSFQVKAESFFVAFNGILGNQNYSKTDRKDKLDFIQINTLVLQRIPSRKRRHRISENICKSYN